jgi:hypothetical protein
MGFQLMPDSTCRGTPNRTSSKYFSPSILIVIKFRLEVLFLLLKGVFLLEGKKIGIDSEREKPLAQIGGV